MWQKVFICFCCCFENIISALNHIRYLSFKMLSFSLLSHLWPFVANTYPELDQGRSLGLVWDPCMYLRLFPSLPLTQDYCASKFGVVGFHESLSHELKAAEKDGIKTTLVCPYLVDTGMFRGCRIRSVKPILLLIKSCFKSHHCIAGEYVEWGLQRRQPCAFTVTCQGTCSFRWSTFVRLISKRASGHPPVSLQRLLSTFREKTEIPGVFLRSYSFGCSFLCKH